MFVQSEIRENIGFITLNRPEKLNSFNREMALQLQQVLDDFAQDRNVRAIYVTGAGNAFSAGQDIEELINGETGLDKILKEHFNPIVTRIRTIAKPVVAAVNGVAAGAGANIALCCDVVVACSTASFIQAFSKIGLVPDSGGTYFLPRLIGFQKASAIMMLGDKISAAAAEKMGMIYKVFDEEYFTDEAMNIVRSLAAMPTLGLGFTKMPLNETFTNSLDKQLETEDYYQRKAASTKDYAEGIDAFLQKRKPIFTGE